MSLPLAIQANSWSSQSRQCFVLEDISCRMTSAAHTMELTLICWQHLNMQAGMNFGFSECIGILHCFVLLLIYHFYLNTRKKNVGGGLENFSLSCPYFSKIFTIALFNLLCFFTQTIIVNTTELILTFIIWTSEIYSLNLELETHLCT